MQYKKYRKYKKQNTDSCLGSVLTFFLYLFFIAIGISIIVSLWEAILIACAIALAIFLIYKISSFVILYFLNRKKQSNSIKHSVFVDDSSNQLSSNTQHNTYESKVSLMTDCEKAFYKVFCKVVNNDYIIQPQVNLASIISKTSSHLYHNELFRNIDFGVFDKSYNLKLLIEINDNTHNSKERRERDKKVHTICTMANIPIITFWTSYGINEVYIEKRLRKYLTLPMKEAEKTKYHETSYD